MVIPATFSGCVSIELTGNQLEESTPVSVRIKSDYTAKPEDAVRSRGIYLSLKDELPDQDQFSKINPDSSTANSFFTTLKNLKPGATYYIRSFVQTDKKYFYSESFKFATPYSEAPKLDSTELDRVSYSAAVVSSGLMGDQRYGPYETGFCYATHYTPDTSDRKVVCPLMNGKFQGVLPFLYTGGTYFVRAYAKNAVGVTYGGQIQFTTYEKSERPTRTPDRKNVSESRDALFYLGALEDQGPGGFRTCKLTGYAYQYAPGDILGELPDPRFKEVSASFHFVYPEKVGVKDPENWKVLERLVEPGEKGLKYGSTVKLYYHFNVLEMITIEFFPGSENDHLELSGILSKELERAYGGADTKGTIKEEQSFNYVIRKDQFREAPISIGMYEFFTSKGADGIVIEFRSEDEYDKN